VKKWNEKAYKNYIYTDFHEYWSWTSKEDFVEGALISTP